MAQNQNNTLKRKLGLFPVTNIVIANMIGAGIFTTSGLLMSDLNNPLIMLGLWIVGGIIALCGALSYSELGAAMPHAGGEYVFLSKLYHPLLGFLSGWVSFIVGFSAAIAASSIGCSEYLTRAFPATIEFTNSGNFINPEMIKKSIAICIILIFTIIHYRGIEFGAIIQNYLTVLKVGLIAILIIVGFIFGKGDITNFFEGSKSTFGFGQWKTIGLSLLWIMFAYSGWNASTYIGSEIKNPTRNIPISLIFGTGIVMILYFLVNIIYVYALSPNKMSGVISIGGLAMDSLFGRSMEVLFSILIAFALFSSLSAFIIIGPRVYYSMAKDGYFFKFVSKVHPVFNVPSKSILLQSGFSIIIVLSGTFDQILTYLGFSLGIFPILAVIGVFKLRTLKTSNYKLPGFPVVPLIYIVAVTAMLILAYMERPVESSIALLTVFAGIPFFFLFKFRNKL
jgi:APA family basic amino acid/polyamine antiporter